MDIAEARRIADLLRTRDEATAVVEGLMPSVDEDPLATVDGYTRPGKEARAELAQYLKCWVEQNALYDDETGTGTLENEALFTACVHAAEIALSSLLADARLIISGVGAELARLPQADNDARESGEVVHAAIADAPAVTKVAVLDPYTFGPTPSDPTPVEIRLGDYFQPTEPGVVQPEGTLAPYAHEPATAGFGPSGPGDQLATPSTDLPSEAA